MKTVLLSALMSLGLGTLLAPTAAHALSPQCQALWNQYLAVKNKYQQCQANGGQGNGCAAVIQKVENLKQQGINAGCLNPDGTIPRNGGNPGRGPSNPGGDDEGPGYGDDEGPGYGDDEGPGYGDDEGPGYGDDEGPGYGDDEGPGYGDDEGDEG